MTKQDQKYLTKAMGLCWHEWVENKGHDACNHSTMCSKCWKYPHETNENIDFTSEHGFFVAFEWAKKQEWWDDFWEWLEDEFYKEMEAKGCHREKWGDYFWRKTVSCQFGDEEGLIGPRFTEELCKFLEGGNHEPK